VRFKEFKYYLLGEKRSGGTDDVIWKIWFIAIKNPSFEEGFGFLKQNNLPLHEVEARRSWDISIAEHGESIYCVR
jgi:hypothetical protein